MARVHLIVGVLQHLFFSGTSGFYGFQNQASAKLKPPVFGLSSAPVDGIGAGADGGVFQPSVSSTFNGLKSSKPTQLAPSRPAAVNGFHFTNGESQSNLASGLKWPLNRPSVSGFGGKLHTLNPEEFEKKHNIPSFSKGFLVPPKIPASASLTVPHGSSLTVPHGSSLTVPRVVSGFQPGFNFFSNAGLPKRYVEGPKPAIPVTTTTTPTTATTTTTASTTTAPATTTTTTSAAPPTITTTPATTTTAATTTTTTTSTAPPTTTTTTPTTTTWPATTTTTTSTAPPTTTTTPATTTTAPMTTTTTTSAPPTTTPTTTTITTTTTTTTTTIPPTTTSKKQDRRDPRCPRTFTLAGGLCYKIYSVKKRHGAAVQTCRKAGPKGRLPILNTEEKFKALRAGLFSAKKSGTYWVGLKSPGGTRMTWDDNSSVNRRFWAPGEPNNWSEKCGDMRTNLKYKLNDVPCSPYKFSFVCEIPL